MPVTFAGAEMPSAGPTRVVDFLRSSARPTANITTAPSTTPSGSELLTNRGSNRPMFHATAIAARNPRNMATPPTAAVGWVWTRRSSGCTTQPSRSAHSRTSGVAISVTPAATPPTITYAAKSGIRTRLGGGTRRPGDARCRHPPAVLVRERQRISGCGASVRIGGELGAEIADVVADGRQLLVVAAVAQGAGDEAGDLGHL